jgi:hypothetical protein
MFYPRPSDEFYLCGPCVVGENATIKDLREYLEKNQKSFSETVIENLIRKISIKQAASEWLETIKSDETRRKYRRALEAIFTPPNAETVIAPDSSIITLDRWLRYKGGEFRLIDSNESFPVPVGSKGLLKWISETTRKQYLTAYSQFCDFIRTETWGFVEPEISLKENKQLIEAEDLFSLIENWTDFIKEIKSPFNLIAELVFYAAKEAQYRIKVVDPINNILSLDTNQIDFNTSQVHIKAQQSYHKMGLLLTCPPVFMKTLKDYIGNRTGTIFLSSKETKLFPRQVLRAFEEASKKLEITTITPVNLGWIGFIKRKQELREIKSRKLLR